MVYENVRSSRFFPRTHELFSPRSVVLTLIIAPMLRHHLECSFPPFCLVWSLLYIFRHVHRYPFPLFALYPFLLSFPDAVNKWAPRLSSDVIFASLTASYLQFQIVSVGHFPSLDHRGTMKAEMRSTKTWVAMASSAGTVLFWEQKGFRRKILYMGFDTSYQNIIERNVNVIKSQLLGVCLVLFWWTLELTKIFLDKYSIILYWNFHFTLLWKKLKMKI